jgi:hypothetical protein
MMPPESCFLLLLSKPTVASGVKKSEACADQSNLRYKWQDSLLISLDAVCANERFSNR